MNLDLHKPKDQVENDIRDEKNQETGHKKVGSFQHHRGHRVFEYNEEDQTVKECEYFYKDDTARYDQAAQGKRLTQNKAIKVKPNHTYVKKLNMKNALKHFRKLYGSGVEDYKIEEQLN